MPINVTFNGVVYPIPVQGDRNWAPPLTRYLVALAGGSFQTTGGLFTLTADANFGPSFGLLAKYFTSVTALPSLTGSIRLAKTDTIDWRNNANTLDLPLGINGSDQLTFNGVPIGTTAVLPHNDIFVGNVSNQPSPVPMSGDATISDTGAVTISNGAITAVKIASGTITNTQINASAAIAVTKLAALTPSAAVATDGSGFLTSSSTTATELGFVSGVTSSIQTQINSISATTVPTGSITMYGAASAPSGWLLCDGTSYSTGTWPALFAIIGHTFGGSGGSFNVPNFINNVPIGAGSIAALGATAGSSTVTVIQNPFTVLQNAHQHATTMFNNNGGATTGIDNTHPYGTTSVSHNFADWGSSDISASAINYENTSNVTATNQAITATNQASSVVQPSLGVTFIIKT